MSEYNINEYNPNGDQETIGGLGNNSDVFFNHTHFEFGLNTADGLYLFNKKPEGETFLLHIEIEKGEGKAKGITSEIREKFKDYLTFLNLIITLIKNDKMFNSTTTVSANGYNDFLSKSIKQIDNKFGMKIPGKKSTHDRLRRVIRKDSGIQNDGVNAVSGMIYEKENWLYAIDATNRGYIIESPYTMIMEMLVTAEKETNVTFNVNELRLLLVKCISEKDTKGDAETELIKSLGSLETMEDYLKFLDQEYGKFIDIIKPEAKEAAKKENVKKEAVKEAKAVAAAAIPGSNTQEENVKIGMKNDADMLAAAAISGSNTQEDNDADMLAPVGQGQMTNGEDEEFHPAVTDLSKGGQKSKTLKRKRQTNNKSKRRHK
jgi:hypothetical protein